MKRTDEWSRPVLHAVSALMTAGGRAGGAALGAATAVIAVARNAPKPLHPRGRYFAATLTRHGSAVPSGVRWIDEPATEPCVVRHSAAIGIPFGLPDIQGIAIQVDTPQGDGHLLFANTGLGLLSRYVLTATPRIDSRPYTTLLPYRTPAGPLLLGLEPQSPTQMTLLWARASGAWQRFGTLELNERHNGTPISFDPMLNNIPGLDPYPWVLALRAPAYRVARRHRGDDEPRSHLSAAAPPSEL